MLLGQRNMLVVYVMKQSGAEPAKFCRVSAEDDAKRGCPLPYLRLFGRSETMVAVNPRKDLPLAFLIELNCARLEELYRTNIILFP